MNAPVRDPRKVRPETFLEDVAHSLENPYWEIVKKLPGDGLSWGGWSPESYPVRRLMASENGAFVTKDGRRFDKQPDRTELVRKYSFAIPSPSSVAFILEELNGRPVVEVGCGTGYWAWLLSQAGIAVSAYDQSPPGEGWNHYHSPHVKQRHVYTDQERHEHYERWKKLDDLVTGMEDALRELKPDDPERAFIPPRQPYRQLPREDMVERPNGTSGAEYHFIAKGGPEVLGLHDNLNRALLLSWPPYDDDFGLGVIQAYQGDTIIYIGEGDGGCCGNDSMFALLDEEWVEDGYCDHHVSWGGIHDHLIIYRRKHD